MKIDISILRIVFLISVLMSFSSAKFALVDCSQIFSSSYAGPIANFTDYSGMVNIALLIIMIDFGIMALAYAIGTGFQLNGLVKFAQTELLEGVFNVVILVAVGLSILYVPPAVSFFLNLANTFAANPIPVGSSTLNIFTSLCSSINTNIVNTGFNNWLGLVWNLYIANTLQSANVLVIPNSYGYAFQPWGGVALLVQLLWDDQTAFFGTMFFGMFLIVLLFIIYYLFPIFLYVGIALRSFPWTRAAGGSFIGLFIAFYIVFPALMYPFVVTVNPGPGICGAGGGDGSFGAPFSYASGYVGAGNYTGIPGHAETSITSQAQFNSFGGSATPQVNPLCNSGDFTISSLKSLITSGSLRGWNFGAVYYTDVTEFVSGFFYVGLNMFGLIVALLISYEIVEKLAQLLGAPSINAQRALSRIL